MAVGLVARVLRVLRRRAHEGGAGGAARSEPAGVDHGPYRTPDPPSAEARDEVVFAVVANIGGVRGPNARRAHGTRHFAYGTKVWVRDVADGRRYAEVVGRSRGARRHVTTFVSVDLLEDPRVEQVRSAALRARLLAPLRDGRRIEVGAASWEHAEGVAELLASLTRRP